MKTLSSIPPSIMPLECTSFCQPDIVSEIPKPVNLFATVVNKKSQYKQPQVHDIVTSAPLSEDNGEDWSQDQIEDSLHCPQAHEYDSIEELSEESSSNNGTVIQDDHTHIPAVADVCTVKVVQLKSSQNLTPVVAEEDGESQLASDYSKCPVSQLRSMCSQRGIRLARNAKKVQMLQALREHDNNSSPC